MLLLLRQLLQMMQPVRLTCLPLTSAFTDHRHFRMFFTCTLLVPLLGRLDLLRAEAEFVVVTGKSLEYCMAPQFQQDIADSASF